MLRRKFYSDFKGQTAVSTATTSGPTTASASYATIPEMTATLTTRGGKLKATMTIQYAHSVLAAITNFAFSLDGAAEVGVYVSQEYVATYVIVVQISHLFTGVSAGSHTVTGRWSTNNASATASSTNRELTLEEVP